MDLCSRHVAVHVSNHNVILVIESRADFSHLVRNIQKLNSSSLIGDKRVVHVLLMF